MVVRAVLAAQLPGVEAVRERVVPSASRRKTRRSLRPGETSRGHGLRPPRGDSVSKRRGRVGGAGPGSPARPRRSRGPPPRALARARRRGRRGALEIRQEVDGEGCRGGRLGTRARRDGGARVRRPGRGQDGRRRGRGRRRRQRLSPRGPGPSGARRKTFRRADGRRSLLHVVRARRLRPAGRPSADFGEGGPAEARDGGGAVAWAVRGRVRGGAVRPVRDGDDDAGARRRDDETRGGHLGYRNRVHRARRGRRPRGRGRA